MKIIAPQYYEKFHCTASACRHTCCAGWEVEIDAESLERFRAYPDIFPCIEQDETAHFRLETGERCPFLNGDGLCRMILCHGEDILCQTCRDHPRFRSFWTDRTELGLGLVCEEAARLILSQPEPMRLIELSDDGELSSLPEDEAWLLELRERLLSSIEQSGPEARLLEYLIYRHLPDALYDNRVEERIAFIREAYGEIVGEWEKTDGSIEKLAECARKWSYDVEYDTEELENRLSALDDN
ncbi:MAG: flagellin lysine-N-methylase [Oscillospiraceae bacterium]|nr:flagellin lysine-N-methylase [Oscillospiraceae bacterium]